MKISVFTKHWPTLPIEALCKKVVDWGADGVEFPLRDGYQAEPKNAERDLPRIAKIMADGGISIMNVASSTEENIFAACQAADVPLIRIMPSFSLERGYLSGLDDYRKYLEGLIPLCEKYKVKVGVQNHYGSYISSSLELKFLLKDIEPSYIGAYWDAGHSGLAGEPAHKALDIIWDNIVSINLKNAYWRWVSGLEAPRTEWKPHFTLGRHGMASFPEIISYLIKRGYGGDICVPAEYTDTALTDELAPLDVQYVKELLAVNI